MSTCIVMQDEESGIGCSFIVWLQKCWWPSFALALSGEKSRKMLHKFLLIAPKFCSYDKSLTVVDTGLWLVEKKHISKKCLQYLWKCSMHSSRAQEESAMWMKLKHFSDFSMPGYNVGMYKCVKIVSNQVRVWTPAARFCGGTLKQIPHKRNLPITLHKKYKTRSDII